MKHKASEKRRKERDKNVTKERDRIRCEKSRECARLEDALSSILK